jgi:hypothetical protein
MRIRGAVSATAPDAQVSHGPGEEALILIEGQIIGVDLLFINKIDGAPYQGKNGLELK